MKDINKQAFTLSFPQTKRVIWEYNDEDQKKVDDLVKSNLWDYVAKDIYSKTSIMSATSYSLSAFVREDEDEGAFYDDVCHALQIVYEWHEKIQRKGAATLERLAQLQADLEHFTQQEAALSAAIDAAEAAGDSQGADEIAKCWDKANYKKLKAMKEYSEAALEAQYGEKHVSPLEQ